MTNLTINKKVELKAGMDWIKLSFYTFREKPLQFFLLSLCTFLVNFLPFLGAFLSPLLVGRFVNLAHKVEHQEPVTNGIFNGIFSNPGLLRLALFNFIFLNLIILVRNYFLGEYIVSAESSNILSKLTNPDIRMEMLLYMLAVFILQIAMWLSPVICYYNSEIKPLTAMGLSLRAGLFNISTILLYSILVLVFTLLAMLPLGLGLIIWWPILDITVYHIYKDILIKND